MTSVVPGRRRERQPPHGPARSLPRIFVNPVPEERLVAHLISEHRRGRRVENILEDPYIVSRTTEEQRLRLLERRT